MDARWKKRVGYLAVGLGLVVGGFVGGRVYQHLQNGYSRVVLEEKEYATALGAVRWRCTSETVGFRFLEPETTELEFAGRTIYKARRGFQESMPVARNVRTDGGSVMWDDGEYAFHLSIEEVKKAEGRGK
jgi:hypothetical protein